MAIEDFIRSNYSYSTTQSARSRDPSEYSSRGRSSLKSQRKRMSKRRVGLQEKYDQDTVYFKSMIDAGVIESTKDGMGLVSGTTAEKQKAISERMEILDEKQLDAVGELVKARGGVFGPGWYKKQRELLRARRAESANLLMGLGTDLNTGS